MRHSTIWASTIVIAAMLCSPVFLTGCVPLIPEDQLLPIATELGLKPEETCEKLKHDFGVPDAVVVDTPAELGIPYEESFVPTPDGQTLRLWYLPNEEARGTVVISNGTVGTAPCYLWVGERLYARGWSVGIYEYRGFGGSSGVADAAGLWVDGDTAMTWFWERAGKQPLVLMGVSLGAIPAAAYAHDYPERVAAVILDGAVSVRHELRRYWYLFGARPDHYAESIDRHFLLDEMAYGLVEPTLAFTYGHEEWITPMLLPDLLAVAPGEVELYHFPRLKHARGPYMATEEYFAVLDDFLARAVPAQEPAGD